MQTHYDIIIIWAWAAGLFTSIEIPSYLSKLILEKNQNPWVKVLLSGWERANVSNINIEPERDYFGQNKKALISMFKKYNQFDIMWFFAENWINIVEEDRWRLILESWDSRELLNLLLKKSRENNTDIVCDSEVIKINPPVLTDIPLNKGELKGDFEVEIINWKKYTCKKLVITTWWKSFSQVGTTWDGYKWAKNFWHTILTPHRWLCWLVTKKDLTEISWVSLNLQIELFDKKEKKSIYVENWPLLFTHFWVSGPIIFNTSVALWEYLNKLNIFWETEFIKENIFLKLTFNLEKTPKRIIKFFDLSEENLEILLELQDFRTWKEAKVTSGWINIDELTNNLESKIVPWLYFAWEILDITGKTGWYNLQFAWTSWHIVGKSIK